MQKLSISNLENLYNNARPKFRLDRKEILKMNQTDLDIWINHLPSNKSDVEEKIVTLIRRQVKNRISAQKSRNKFKNKMKKLQSENENLKNQNENLKRQNENIQEQNNKLNEIIGLKNSTIKDFLDIFANQNQLITKLAKELEIYKSPHNINHIPITLTPSLSPQMEDDPIY